VSEGSQLMYPDLKTSSLVILGGDNPLVGRFFGNFSSEAGFSVLVRENPWNSGKVVGIFDARSKGEIDAAFKKVFHYVKIELLSKKKGEKVEVRVLRKNFFLGEKEMAFEVTLQ
jgi:hypothetical protein